MSPSSKNTIPQESTTVVIVGAGPSGLMLACNLVRYGIPIVLLDDRPDKTAAGKADGMQPKTIETFRQMRLAEPLLRNSVRVYDIAFWESTPDSPLHRTGRKTHYPDHLVGAADPYILLAHQGIVEDTLIQDMQDRGMFVRRNTSFIACERLPSGRLRVEYTDTQTGCRKTIISDYLVGCDGARSKVREFIPGAQLEGDMTNASWGVLDGVIETDFPDLWSKVAVRSHTAGSILWIPRERNMTRLYVQLSSTDGERVDRNMATPEYVMKRAADAMHPFSLKWKSIEWFGNYVVGQRVARKFSDEYRKIFIAGDAGHVHSALAAQGANTSMHDAFNLAWKLNLVIRGLASPSLLSTYEEERRKIAYDLINFDAGHCEAFAQGDEALARNFDDNIRFISGIGAEYNPGQLTVRGTSKGKLKPGALMIPAKVIRYIDANPVDIQIDIPMLGQFRLYFFVPEINAGMEFLETIFQKQAAIDTGRKATRSYTAWPRGYAPSDEFLQPQRYIPVSNLFTYAIVTKTDKSQFEIADLPKALQSSRWTLYLDNVETPSCTDKWMGPLDSRETGIVIVRPDGYAGAIGSWDVAEGYQAVCWVEEYFECFM